MKKTILTLAVMMAGILGAQAQTENPKLVLDDTKDLVAVINAAAEKGGKYDVTFSDRPINLGGWNVLVLPFDLKPFMISRAFGYAIPDVLIKNSTDGNIHFDNNLSTTIPAGTPFILHISKEDCPADNFKDITFKNVTLKQVKASYTEEDSYHNRFVSTFSPVTFYGSKYWYMSKGSWYNASKFTEEKPVSLKPLRAYVDFSQNTVKKAPMIIIEEPDGTITAIDPAAFNQGGFSTDGTQDNGWYTVTGMRLADEPAAKGVYIHNARKVVIK